MHHSRGSEKIVSKDFLSKHFFLSGGAFSKAFKVFTFLLSQKGLSSSFKLVMVWVELFLFLKCYEQILVFRCIWSRRTIFSNLCNLLFFFSFQRVSWLHVVLVAPMIFDLIDIKFEACFFKKENRLIVIEF